MDSSVVPAWVGYATLSVTIGLLIAAIFAFIIAKRQLKLQTFTRLLQEITNNEARVDRGFVHRIKTGSVKEMKDDIELVRKGEDNNNARIGQAAERTIARLDRVGFFLLGKRRKKTTTDVPEWLWTIVDQQWQKLGVWVNYRQTIGEKDKENYHRGYGYYFAKLAKLARKKVEKRLDVPYPMETGP